MAFPDTPVTLVSRLKEPGRGIHWEDDWRKFVKDYQNAIEKSVVGAFYNKGWKRVDQHLVEEIVAEVVVAFVRHQHQTPFDPEKGRLRSFLSQLVQWRVIDHIRRHYSHPAHEPLENWTGQENETTGQPSSVNATDLRKWEAEEDLAHQRAILAMLIDDVRERVNPRAFAIFDEVKLQHRSPEEVAKEFQISRNVVDNQVHKVLNKLRELASTPDYKKEINP